MKKENIFERCDTEFLEELTRIAFAEDSHPNGFGYTLWQLQTFAQIFLQPKWRRGKRLPEVSEEDAHLILDLHAKMVAIGAAIQKRGSATLDECTRLVAIAAALGALGVRYPSLTKVIQAEPRQRGLNQLVERGDAKDRQYLRIAKQHRINLKARGAAIRLVEKRRGTRRCRPLATANSSDRAPDHQTSGGRRGMTRKIRPRVRAA